MGDCLEPEEMNDNESDTLGNSGCRFHDIWLEMVFVLFARAHAGTVIGICCNIACLLAVLLKPYMPVTADILKEQLQAPDDVWVMVPEFTILLPAGHKLGKVRSTEQRHQSFRCFSVAHHKGCIVILCIRCIVFWVIKSFGVDERCQPSRGMFCLYLLSVHMMEAASSYKQVPL